MFKKLWCTLLAIALCVGALSGCGTKQQQAGSELDDDQSKEYNIVWYYIAGNATQDHKMVNDEVNKIVKEKINATVEMIPIDWGSYESKMNTIIASGEAFDICFTANWILNVDNNASRGAFLPIQEYVRKYGNNILATLGEDAFEMAKTNSSDLTINGNTYYIPTLKEIATSYGFMYRKDLVEKYNIDIENINSYEELIPALEIIKQNEPDVTPTYIGGGSSPFSLIDYRMIEYPAVFFESKDKGIVYNMVETPEFEEAAKMCRRLVVEGYARKDGALIGDVAALKNEGHFFSWVEPLKPGKDKEISVGKKHEYIQHQVTQSILHPTNVSGSALAVSRTSENPSRTIKFIDMLYGDKELLNLFNYGIEGIHYKKVGENRIEKFENPGYDRAGLQWMIGNTFNCYLLPNEEDDKYLKLKKFNDEAKRTIYADFRIPQKNLIKTEIATCNNVKTEFFPMLETGSVDVDVVLPKFREKLKQSGADKIMEVATEAAKEWLKTH